MLKSKSIIFILLFLGLILRLWLAVIPGFKIDVDAWFAWAIRLNNLPFNQFYSSQVWTNYTPGYLYILKLLGFLDITFHLNSIIFYYLLKLPAILADLTLSYLIFKQFNPAGRGQEGRKTFVGLILASAILFNPAFIFNSTVWGQIDSLLSLFIYLAILFLEKRKIWLTGLFVSLAMLIKPQSIILLPIMGVVLVKKFEWKNLLLSTGVAIATLFLFSTPFFTGFSSLGSLIHLFLNMANDYPYTSLYAYNLWGAVGFWISDQQLWLNLAYQWWGSLLFLIYLAGVLMLSLHKKLSIWSIASLVSLGFYFLPTRVHDRYLYPSLVLLIISSGVLKNKLIIILTIFLSILHLLNLYFVYIYYNHFYLNLPSTIYYPTIYEFLNSHGQLLSTLSTLIFVILCYLVIKSDYAKKTD